MNPLLPAWYDFLWSGFALALLVLTVVAFVSFLRTPLTAGRALAWAAVILLLPALGPILWFALRPERRPRPSAH